MSEPIRLNSNENLLGPSPMAVAAMKEAMSKAHVYPGNEDQILTEKLAALIGKGIRPEQFVLGNGSGDVLRMLVQHYAGEEHNVVMPLPTFAAYKRLIKVHRSNLTEVPVIDHQIDLDGLVNACTSETTLIFLCNPNNPTGQYVNHAEMGEFLSKVPDHVVVIVDEAYQDFSVAEDFPDMMEYINAGHNVIVARTFSKVYGLASMRVGYGYGKESLVTPVRDNRVKSETGIMAYIGAAAALNDEAHIVNSIDMVRDGREYFYKEFDRLGIEYLRSQAFFITIPEPPIDGPTMVAEALEQNVMLRDAVVFDMPGSVRVSIGRPQDNERAVEVIESVLRKHGVI